jgi:hypothetical protein
MGSRTMLSIGQAVQLQAIADLVSISNLTHLIEASGIFLHRLVQELGLCWCGLQLDAYRAYCYHVHVVTQCGTKVNNSVKKGGGVSSPQLEAGSLHAAL